MDPTTHPQWAAADHARRACLLGECRYPGPALAPDPDRGARGCQGYAATVHGEAGQLVMRWRLCARHRAWWQAERVRIRQRRQRERAQHQAAQRSGAAMRPLLPGDEA